MNTGASSADPNGRPMMNAVDWHFAELTAGTQDAVRALILAGLEQHWGSIDPSLNPDLDNMLESYATGQTVVALKDADVIGTGTIVPSDQQTMEIVRMSVDARQRRSGLGRSIVEELCTRAQLAGSRRVILETSSAWTEVVAFYLSCGFVITHTEDSEFGEDTWFEKPLSPLSQL